MAKKKNVVESPATISFGAVITMLDSETRNSISSAIAEMETIGKTNDISDAVKSSIKALSTSEDKLDKLITLLKKREANANKVYQRKITGTARENAKKERRAKRVAAMKEKAKKIADTLAEMEKDQ